MLFPRLLNSSNISLNGIPENYAPAIPADSVVQTLTPFEIVRKASLKVLYRPVFKGIVSIVPTATTINVKVNDAAVTSPLSSVNLSTAGSDITSTAANGTIHFGKAGNVLGEGDKIEISNFPATGQVNLFLLEKQDTVTFNNSFGIGLSITDQGTFFVQKITGAGTTTLVNNVSITAIDGVNKLVVEITPLAIVIKRNTTVLYTHNLQYKARLLNEAGNAVDANAGILTLADGSAYGNGLVAANTELKYTIGDVLGAYNVEFESEVGRKILQKVIVVDTGSGSGSLSNLPISQIGVNDTTTSPASWWNRNKTYVVIGAVFLAVSLIGAYIINKLSK